MQTFYQYLMTFRHSLEKNEISILAEHVFRDPAFPKTSTNFQELSHYFELDANYLLNMSLFDEIWLKYDDYQVKKVEKR